jgi:hypothetical protein
LPLTKAADTFLAGPWRRLQRRQASEHPKLSTINRNFQRRQNYLQHPQLQSSKKKAMVAQTFLHICKAGTSIISSSNRWRYCESAFPGTIEIYFTSTCITVS